MNDLGLPGGKLLRNGFMFADLDDIRLYYENALRFLHQF